MKTRLSLLLVLTFGFFFSEAQSVQKPTPNRPIDNISFCGAGGEYVKKMNDAYTYYLKNKVTNPSIPAPYSFIPLTTFPSSLVVTCGSFNLYYEDDVIAATTTTVEGFADPVLGGFRKTTLCAVLNYIESVIDIQGPIDIFISQSFSNPGNPYTGTGSFLAFAGPSNPAGFSATPGIYNGHFFNHATTGTDPDVNNYDMEMTVNFHQLFDPIFMTYTPITYYDDYTNTSTDCNFDLYTVLLHEITHGMGFISFVSEDTSPSHLPYNGNNSVIFNNAFSGFDDKFLYKGDIFTTTFTKVVTTAPAIDGSIGTMPDALRQNDIWLYNTANPLNQPVYSGNWLNESLIYTNWPMNPPSFMSHMAYDFSSFSGMAQYSPGYQAPYVMGPYVDKEEFRREWPVPEIRILTALGYSLNPIFSVSTSLNGIEQNGNLLANNSPAFRSNPTVSVTAINSDANFTEMAAPDFTIINSNTPTSTVSVLSIGISTLVNTSDNNGDVISIMPGTLFGIRGVTSGGDNHNLLSVNAGSTVVTYTPVPGYWGLAQFGFYLWDGRERGAFKTITIDVQQGSYTPAIGQELVINSSFEDGTEVKQRLGPNSTLPYTGIHSGYENEYFAGTHFSGGQPYPFLANWWGPYGAGNIVFQSYAECYFPSSVQGRFGYATSSADNPGSNLYNPNPLNTIPNNDRYATLFNGGNVPYFLNLQDNLVFNNYYQVEFDAAFSTGTGNSNGNPFIITLNAVSNPIPNPWGVTIYETENVTGNIVTVNNAQGDMFWQHVVYTFQYCSSTPANQINIISSLHRTYIDNFSIKQVINPPAFTSVSAFATPTVVCAGVTTSLIAIPDNNSCILTYTWNPGNIVAQNTTVTPASTTVYTVTATDGVTTATAAVTVSVVPLPTVNVTATAYTICAGQSVTLTASGADTYYWNPLAVNGTTVVVTPTVSTTYYITGTDVNSCSSYTDVTITVGGAAVAITITPSVSTICSGQTATLTASGVSTYTWDNGANTNTIAVNPAITTIYTVSGTDVGGCSGSTTATVIVNPSPSLSVSPSGSTICAGPNVILTVSGAATYTWDTGATTNTISVSPTVTTIYTVTGTDASGCTGSITASIVVNPVPVLTITPTSSTICAKETQTLVVSGASTYSWSTGATTSTIVETPFSTTVYTVTGTDVNGCSSVASATITVNPTPAIIISPPSLTLCAGETTTLTASGAVTYTWDNGANTNSIVVNPTVSTVYTVTGTDVNGCPGINIASISVNTPPSITITPLSSTICTGQSATLTASGANTYTWSTGATTSTISVSPVATTVYTLTGTDINGCTGTASSTIVVNTPPVISITGASTICAGQSSTLTASGGSTYTWQPGSSTSNPFIVTPGATTVYSVTGADAFGCTGTAQFTVMVFPTPTIAVVSVGGNTICAGQTATLIASGAISYTWQPGSLSGNPLTVNPSATTVYTVSGTNQNGCSSTTQFTLVVIPTPTVIAAASSTNICAGQCATLTASGATTYTWMPGSLTGITTVVCPAITTTYTVTGTTAGCSSTATITIFVSPVPTIGISASSPTVCSLTTVTLTASGGSTYTWQPGSIIGNPIVVSPSSTTVYTVTGMNSVGCTGTNTVLVTFVSCICTSCTPVGISGTLTTSAFSNSVLCINVPTVTIIGNVNITNCEVKMSPSVSIVVAPGSTLTILLSHLYSCTDMWKGIIVQDGGRLSIRSSLFEDAMTGVDITNNTQASATPPVLSIAYSTFNRNKVSVAITNYVQTISTYPFIIENSLFTCRDIPFTPNSIVWPTTPLVAASAVNPGFPLTNVYISNSGYLETSGPGYLKNPYPGQKSDAGIYLNNVGVTLNPQTTSPTYYEFQIGGNNNRNIFDNQNIGVRLFNSNFSSYNNVYQNTVNGGNGIFGSSDIVHNCRVRVLPNNNMTGAGNNSFVDCGKGAMILNYFEYDISFCDVRTPQTLPMFSGRIGFYIKTNRYRTLNVSKNSIYNLENGISVNATYGFYNLTGPTVFGQYAGKINVNQNLIRPQLPSFSTFGRYVSNAITLQNISGSGLVYANSLTPLISASNNTLINVYRGVYYVNWKLENITANSNSVTLVPDPSSLSPTQYGIKVAYGTGATSFGNSIKTNTVAGYGTGNPNLYGILTVNTGSVVKSCNRVSAVTNGIEFDALNANTSFNKNFISSAKYGYVLNWNGFINTQGSYSSPQDNQWTGTWAGNFKTATINSTAQNSKFHIRTAAASNFNPDLSGYTFPGAYGTTDYAIGAIPPTLITPTSAILPYLGCPVIISSTLSPPIFTTPSGTMTPVYEDIALKKFPYFVNQLETEYMNWNELYRTLKADPALRASSTVLQNFYNAYVTSNFDLMDVIETDIANGNFNVAGSNIAFFSPQNTIETNYKDFYRLWLTYQINNSLSSSDNSKLFAIAGKCPFSEGMVIYQARSLYNIANNTFISFEGNCGGGSVARFAESSGQTSPMSSFDAIVFPNPGNGNLNISLSNYNGSELDLIVKDVSGRTVYNKSHNISNGFTKLELDVRDGIYFLIMVNKQTKEQLIKKFVIEN